VRLEIDNHIPLARGLGSSSAAIVGGLATGLLLSKRERGARSELSAEERSVILSEATRIEGHPDNVAPAALGDLVICGVERGVVITIPQSWPERLELVAVIPELAVRTEAARRALPAMIPHADAVANGARLARLLGSLQTERLEHLSSALRDRLHQPYRLPLATGLSDVLSALEQETHSLGAYLSGSGPTIIALCTSGSKDLGEAGVRAFAHHGVAAAYRVLHVDRAGVTTGPLARRSNENAPA
jgi:homoserine kinase